MSNKKKLAAILMIGALSIGSATGAYADTGHTPGLPPQVKTVLSQLVIKGTINQSQSDAIVAALEAAAPVAGSEMKEMGKGMGKGKGMGGFGKNSVAREAVITSTLGITSADLKAAHQAGKSLATLAGSKTDALIAALVAFDTNQIDAAVTAGTLTASQATNLKANLKTHVTNEVNAVRGGKSITKTVTKTITKSKA